MNNDEIIYAIIKKSKKNLTAYEILDKAQKNKKVQPMTIYRSLKNLTDKGLIHKSNFNKTYTLCNHSHQENHNTILAICKKCGIAEEIITKLRFSDSQRKKLKKLSRLYHQEQL